MKQLTCEMCGSTDLMKQDGVFVCQSCGCKYSVEEARKMMVEGTVEVTGTIKVDNTAQINNYLELSKNAYDSGNGQSALDYANKALEIAPQNSQAWICKMKAIEYVGTLGNLRLMEVIEAGKNAINSAASDEKETIELEVYKYELTRSLALLKLAMNKMADSADIKQTFQRLAMISVFTAGQNALNADSKVVNIYDNIANEAIAMVKLIPDDALVRYPALPKLVLECAKQYQYETNALIERYKIYGATLNDSAVTVRNSNKRSLEDKANKAIKVCKDKEIAAKKAAAEKRFKEYWENHADEKVRLEEEKLSLEEKISVLNAKIDSIVGKEEQELLRQQISELTKQKSGLGLFKGKEKKEIQGKIDSLNQKLMHISERIDREKSEIEKEISPLKNRITQINTELTKER